MDIDNRPKRLTDALRKILRNKKSLVGIIIIYLGTILFAFTNIYGYKIHNTEEIFYLTIKVLPGAIIIIGIGYFLFGYLEGNKANNQTTSLSTDSSQNTEQIVTEFKKHFDELRHNQERSR